MAEDIKTDYKTKKLGKKTYIYDTTLHTLAEKVAKEHSIDISNMKIEFALVEPMINSRVAGRCMLLHNEYTLFTEVNYFITFSKSLWKCLRQEQQELLMCHELLHILKKKDKEGNFKCFALAGHTIEDFRYLVTKYGVNWIDWIKDTESLLEQMRKKPEKAGKPKKEEGNE